MNDQLPGCIHTRFGRLRLPKLNIEGTIKLGKFAVTFHGLKG
jgi:hypothetical protein